MESQIGVGLQWFKKCTPDLSFCVAQGPKIRHAKRLCLNNVATFYYNLQHAYDLHNYDASKIWNCNEFGAQVDHNGGALVLTKARSKSMHSITTNKKNGCQYFPTSMHMAIQFPTSTFLKVNN
jgi:hypothetical protein